MKKFFLTVACIVSLHAFAAPPISTNDYTYQKDRRFNAIEQLNGQLFIPQEYSEGIGLRQTLLPGDYKILINGNVVTFSGIEGLERFNIVDRYKTKIGYEFKMVDARGNDFSKLRIVTENSFVKLIYFVSNKYGEHTFFLPNKTSEQIKTEKAYFTQKNSLIITDVVKDLANKKIVPQMINEQTNNPFEVDRSVSIKENLSLEFKDKALEIKANSATKKLTIKKTKLHNIVSKDKKHPNARKMVEIKFSESKSKMKIYLNVKNEIESIEYETNKYLLMS